MAKAIVAPLGAFISFGLPAFIYFRRRENVEKRICDSLLATRIKAVSRPGRREVPESVLYLKSPSMCGRIVLGELDGGLPLPSAVRLALPEDAA
jgi:hypothetical protein